jgi:type II secretory pathway pseudopilin PulG
MHLYERKRLAGLRGVIVTLAVLVMAAFGFIRLVSAADARTEAEQEAQLLEAVRRATVTCYAAEGQYPPTLAYLEENYALRFDDERFIVSYDAFASNIMPSVSILRRDGDA